MNVVIRRCCYIEPDKMQMFYKLHRLYRSWHSHRTPCVSNANNRCQTQSRIPDYCDKTLINFMDVQVFRRLVLNFAHAAAPLSLDLGKDQPQTFDSLGNDETTFLGTLNVQSVEPLCWLLHNRLATILHIRMHATSRLAVSFYREIGSEQIDQ